MINTNALVYFVEAARLRSLTAAAQSLGVSQSTVSKMIKKLEDELGEEVLIRHKKPPRLTALGEHLYEKGREILLALEQLEQDVLAIQSLKKGRLRIGLPPMVNVLFTQVIKEFRQQHPAIELNISELPGPLIEKAIADQQLDFGFSIAPVEQDLALLQEPFVAFPIYAIGSSERIHALKTPLQLAQLSKKPLLLLNDEFALTRLLRLHFTRAKLPMQIYAQSNQWDWLVSMAQAGLGITLLPEPFLARLPKELAYKPISEPNLLWQVTLLWDGRYLSDASRAWLEISRQLLPHRL